MTLPIPLLARIRRSPDLALAAAALGILTLLVAPLPPALLDLCLAANLALSAAIFLVTLFARDTLRLASFPTLLLFTTLLRLSLEISSTRLVLSRGDAGRIIQAFGRVVVAGNYVVGTVLFAILTLVQLLVVTRGAERVAEVAARFTLDALPGKQLSIDADLRAGTIDQGEARRRRRALEREGQLHGAMDGALKFVKGDALAGVAIVLVNVGGGLVAGLLRGMPLAAAARRYALLAIGDGLAAQVPALLVSVAAGVAVTRVAGDDEGSSLAEELARHLFADGRVLAAIAVLCGAMALLPGLPAWPFLALGVAAAVGARASLRGRERDAEDAPPGADPQREVAPATPLTLEVASDLAALDLSQGSRLAPLLVEVQRELAGALGVGVPQVCVRPAALSPGQWRLLLDEVPAGGGTASVDEAVALAAPTDLEAVGIAAVAEQDPLTGSCAARIAAADVERARQLVSVRGPLERIAAGLHASVRAHAHLLVGIQQAQELLDTLEATHPALVREVTRQVPVHVLAEVLRQLLEEGIALRPLHAIAEAMLDAGGATRGAPALAAACRRALRRQIAHRHAGGGALEALLLDPAAEATVREALVGNVAALDPRAVRALLDRIGSELERRAPARWPVLLATPEIRRPLRDVISQRFPGLAVLSYEELPPSLAVRPVGKIAIAVE